MDSIIESWTCQIETDVATFFEALNADSTATWIHSRIGHRSPGCKPLKGRGFAGFLFFGEGERGRNRALTSISAQTHRTGWLTIVINRHEPVQEDEADLAKWGIATWAEVGRKVTTWLRGYIREHYGVEPSPQRAGKPTFDDYSETPTGDQERTEPATKVGTEGYRYWSEIHAQARVSGNVKQYLQDRDISRSSYYDNIKRLGIA